MNEEARLFAERIGRAIDRVVAATDTLTPAQVSWQPTLTGWNSLSGIVAHVLANAEENICGVIGGEITERDRESEFAPSGDSAAQLVARWQRLRPRLDSRIGSLTAEDLGAARVHPRRGQITVREVLIVVVGHVGLHEGHAELTRDYVLAQGPLGADVAVLQRQPFVDVDLAPKQS